MPIEPHWLSWDYALGTLAQEWTDGVDDDGTPVFWRYMPDVTWKTKFITDSKEKARQTVEKSLTKDGKEAPAGVGVKVWPESTREDGSFPTLEDYYKRLSEQTKQSSETFSLADLNGQEFHSSHIG